MESVPTVESTSEVPRHMSWCRSCGGTHPEIRFRPRFRSWLSQFHLEHFPLEHLPIRAFFQLEHYPSELVQFRTLSTFPISSNISWSISSNDIRGFVNTDIPTYSDTLPLRQRLHVAHMSPTSMCRRLVGDMWATCGRHVGALV